MTYNGEILTWVMRMNSSDALQIVSHGGVVFIGRNLLWNNFSVQIAECLRDLLANV
jgi:hypothetical protein